MYLKILQKIDFSIGYGLTDVKDMLNIREYLMKKKMIAKFIESVFVSVKSFGKPWTSQSEKFISSNSESCLVRYDEN